MRSCGADLATHVFCLQEHLISELVFCHSGPLKRDNGCLNNVVSRAMNRGKQCAQKHLQAETRKEQVLTCLIEACQGYKCSCPVVLAAAAWSYSMVMSGFCNWRN